MEVDLINHKKTVPAFRAEAWEHHIGTPAGIGIAKVAPPWSWMILVLCGAMVSVALALAVLGKVEVNQKGPGVLRPVSGIRHLQAQASGIVAEVVKRPGEVVQSGDICIRLDSADLRASVLEAEQNLQAFDSGYGELERRQADAHALRKANLIAKAAQLELDLEAGRRTLERHQRKLKAIQTLRDEGIIPDLDLEKARERIEELERQVRERTMALRMVRQEQEDADTSFRKESWRYRSERMRAQSRHRAVQVNARQQSIPAPVDGYVDGCLVHRGDSVQWGQVVARIVPKDAELRAMAFIQESHRAWIKEGDPVKLEVSQFPFQEFGSLEGRILSMGMDFASPEEVKAALGEGVTLAGPSFQVEVQVLPARKGPLAGKLLRPGMRVEVRFTLRKQRPIHFVFRPIERWLH